jgi:UDP:flavonoid glycosyltransferase YjiC (YdhE family)
MFEGQHSPYGTLALFSPHFVQPQQDWPSNTTATGFCFYDATGYIKPPKEPEPELSWQEWVDSGQSPLDWPSYTNADGTTYYGAKEDQHLKTDPRQNGWKEWMQDGEAPIVFALGSSAVFGAVPFWKQSEILVKASGDRAVFLTGGQQPFGIRQLAPELLELNYAPYSELFPLGKLIVHQGGAGTTAQALRAGVPQLIVPHAHDQPDHAGRITRLGLGCGIPLEKYVRGEGKRTLQKVLADYPAFKKRAGELGEKIRAENGPLAACEAIERCV